MRESPFIFEDAVPREKFFDRKEELDFFVRNLRVKRKMLLCIVAPLKYGKSSLMQRYNEILQRFADVIPIYINLKKIKDPIWFIVESLKSYFDLQYIYREALSREDLLPLFDAINKFLVEEKKWLFLLFDEFHLLPSRIRAEGFYSKFGDEDIFGFFRGFAEGARISYVVCGSVIEPLMDALDVWGGRFQIIYLGPFSEEDAVYMLKKLFAEGGMSISDEQARIIAESAGYHPFYIQYMGHMIYTLGEINDYSIRGAKRSLYEFLSPIFENYFERIVSLGKDYLETLRRVIRGEFLDIWDRARASKLRRIGILKPRNSGYEFVDPLFRRYIERLLEGFEPTEVVVVGHWAERIVGNYLLRKGYIPYYSHDSRGAFDIYVRIEDRDAGIQVKYSASEEIYLSKEEAERIAQSAEDNSWVPIIALVSKDIRFFSQIRPGKYSELEGYSEIEEAIKTYKQSKAQ